MSGASPHISLLSGYADLMTGSAMAATAACAALTAHSCSCWARAFDAFQETGPARRRSGGFAVPARGGREAFPEFPFPLTRGLWPAPSPWTFLKSGPSPAALGMAWASLMPFRGVPASWPLAVLLIAAGLPRSVAVPAAEANVAALDAADAVTAPLRAAFASYRSESGYAVSPVPVPTRILVAAALLPMSLPMWPMWLPAPVIPIGFA